jgi:hypothetical protein
MLIFLLLIVGCVPAHPVMTKPQPIYKVGDTVRLKGYDQLMVVTSDIGYSVCVTWLDKLNQPHSHWYGHVLLESQE